MVPMQLLPRIDIQQENKYKKCNGVNHMRAIYKSTDRQECQNIEKRLCKYLRGGIHIAN